MEQTLQKLQQVTTASKKKTQNTSLDKYELLWDCERQLANVSQDNVKALEKKFLDLLGKDLILQEPTPPLQRVISLWVVKLCSISGSISQALNTLKSFQAIIQQQKLPLTSKLAAMECIGRIYTGLGVSVASTAGDTINVLIKQFKSSFPEKRSTSINTIQKILEAVGPSGVHLHGIILKNIKQVCQSFLFIFFIYLLYELKLILLFILFIA